jgi:hypothetical protein
MNFHCRLEFPATAAEHLRVSAALMRLLSLIAHANRFDPDSSGPATGFPYPLAVSVKPALPTSFSRQRSGFALRRFHPGTSAAYAFPRKPGLLAISTSCSAQTSGQPVRGSKALAVRPVCASKGTRLCLHNPALGFTVLGACVSLTMLLSSKQFRLPAFSQIWVPELVRPPAVLLIRILSKLLRALTPLSRFLRLSQPTRSPCYGLRYFFT